MGLGTVGQGVYKILQKNNLTLKAGASLQVARILVKDPQKNRGIDLPAELLTSQAEDILANPEIDLIVEVLGGLSPAREYVLQALQNGKSVVTANKDLIAEHGEELFAQAEASHCDLFFEASVGGGIPIINSLKHSLLANKIESIMGIINGTTNYMLSKMAAEGSDFAAVLAEAQAKGYAEADPASDVEGLDAARKLAILASIAFNSRVKFPDVYVEGITKISARDMAYAQEFNYTVKLLAIAKESEEGIEVRVHPCFIPQNHPLAAVNGVNNAIYVQGDAVGETMFYGQGAGEVPTASAVVGDLIQAARNRLAGINTSFCSCYDHKPLKSIGQIESQYFIRLLAVDKPGVLASIAYVLGDKEVSLASVLQKDREDGQAEIVMITHRVKEENLQNALKMLEQLSTVAAIGNIIRVEES
ncbi:MAG: homoserine dehydrogenase [Clostridia bacterium]|nr:homoserine dehydrogenase [Clostridia bacterium]